MAAKARKTKSVRRRSGQVPPHLRKYLFKKGHRRNPGRKKRRGAALQVAEQRITTVKRRRKNPSRHSRSEYQANRSLRRRAWALVAKAPGRKALRYTGTKFSDHGKPHSYVTVQAARAAASALRRRYGSVLHRYSLYAAPMMGK